MHENENELDTTTSLMLYFDLRQNTSLNFVLWPCLDLYLWMKAKNWKLKRACFGFCKCWKFGQNNEFFQNFSNFQKIFGKSFPLCLSNIWPKGQISCFKIDRLRAIFVLEQFKPKNDKNWFFGSQTAKNDFWSKSFGTLSSFE